nr:trigger factor [uncultured Lachnoanaerobaculum sp.]
MKLKKLALIGMVVLATMSACGKKSTEESTEAQTTVEGETQADAERPSEYGSAELGVYKGVEIPNIDISVSDAEVESQINTELLQDPDIAEVTDRAVQEGDTVNIDYVGTKDGVAFDGGTASGFDLVIGSHTFIEGFESGLIGHNIGEDVKLDLTFPKDYGNEELAGAAVVFDVKINKISVSTPATLTDEWVNRHTNGAQTTVDAYKALVRTNLEEQRKKSADSQDQYYALNAAVQNAKFDMNDAAIEYEYNNSFKPIEAMITQYNMTLDDYAQAYGLTGDGLKAELRTQAENFVKQTILIREVYKKENMSLTDADYQLIVDMNGGTITKDELIEKNGQEAVDEIAKAYKVVNFLLENAKRSDVTVSITGETLSGGEGESTTAESSKAAQ